MYYELLAVDANRYRQQFIDSITAQWTAWTNKSNEYPAYCRQAWKCTIPGKGGNIVNMHRNYHMSVIRNSWLKRKRFKHCFGNKCEANKAELSGVDHSVWWILHVSDKCRIYFACHVISHANIKYLLQFQECNGKSTTLITLHFLDDQSKTMKIYSLWLEDLRDYEE